ncbi:Myosin regulatory light chain, striated muscle, 25 kDa [Lamellibrachia satsuma]|nr:Myosin regulatory light chain, striated muscle, 25 kDa [Lamellibrachia satsuma]
MPFTTDHVGPEHSRIAFKQTLLNRINMGEDKSSKKEKKSKKKDKTEKDDAADGAGDEPKEPKRAQRATSNVFALFNQAQIQEFKEAFTMMDQNRDGIIDTEDLGCIFQQTGREPDPKQLKLMMEESPNQLNFTHFLTLFGEKLHGTDPENTLRDAFAMFDESGKGQLSEEFVKDLLMNVGDQFSKDEVKQTWKEAPIEGGQLDYLKFVQIIKRGKEED